MQCKPVSWECWQIIKIFWLLPLSPTDETACTWQSHLRPGCRLHAISFLDVVLTPLATYGHYSGLYSSDQGRLNHLKGLWSWPLLWTPYHTHEPGMGSLHQHEHEQMVQKTRTNRTKNTNKWARECEWTGQGTQTNGAENVNEGDRERVRFLHFINVLTDHNRTLTRYILISRVF